MNRGQGIAVQGCGCCCFCRPSQCFGRYPRRRRCRCPRSEMASRWRPMRASPATTSRPGWSSTSPIRSICGPSPLPIPIGVVVDIPQVNFQFPPRTGEHSRGVIKAFLIWPGDERALPHRDRRHRSGPGVAGVRRRPRRRPAGPPGGRYRAGRSRNLPARRGDRQPPAAPRRAARSPRDEPAKSGGDTDFGVGRRHRPRAWRHRYRHPCAEAASRKRTLVLSFATMLRDKLEKIRQIPRGDDALGRHFRATGGSGKCSAWARRRNCSSRSTAMRWRAAAVPPMGRPSIMLSDQASDAEAQRLADAENRADIKEAGVNLAEEPG